MWFPVVSSCPWPIYSKVAQSNQKPQKTFTYVWLIQARHSHSASYHLLSDATDGARCAQWLQLQPHINVELKIAACLLISYLFVIHVPFLNVEEGLVAAALLLQIQTTCKMKKWNKGRRSYQLINRHLLSPFQNACVGMFICVWARDGRVCLWEREYEVWRHFLNPPVDPCNKKRASHSPAPREPYTTCLPDNRRPLPVF